MSEAQDDPALVAARNYEKNVVTYTGIPVTAILLELASPQPGEHVVDVARDAGTITAGDIIQAVEGPIAVVECILYGPEQEHSCHRVDRCVAHLLWQHLTEAISGILDSVTLHDLANQAQ